MWPRMLLSISVEFLLRYIMTKIFEERLGRLWACQIHLPSGGYSSNYTETCEITMDVKRGMFMVFYSLFYRL